MSSVSSSPRSTATGNERILKRLAQPDFAYAAMRPISVMVAILLLLIGAFGFLAIIL